MSLMGQDGDQDVAEKISNSTKLNLTDAILETDDSLLVRSIATGQQPDGDYVTTRADGEFFRTSTELAANATFTSDWYDSDGYGTVEFFFSAQVSSAEKGILIEWSDDVSATTPDILTSEFYEFSESDVRKGYRDIHVRPRLDGFRLKYTNGTAAQTNVYISATGRVYPETGFTNSGNAIVSALFEREVALGKVSNYSQNTKFGRNPEVDTGVPADIWGGGRNALGLLDYTGFNATANENLSTASSLAADTGALVSSGTITTTAVDILIDSAATFVTDGVAVGDIVLNDSRGTYGYVTSIDSETQVSVFKMLDTSLGQYTNILGNSYRIATTSGAGAAVVSWNRVLNSDFEKKGNVFVIMNGTTPVVSTIDAYRCSRGRVLLAGSSGQNDGEIRVNQAVTTANVFCVMPTGSNQTLICCDTVPKGEVYLIETTATAMSISGGASASAVVSLQIRPFGGVFNTQRIYDLSSGGGEYTDTEIGGINLDPGTDFKLRVDTVSSNNTRVSGKIEYLEIDEIT